MEIRFGLDDRRSRMFYGKTLPLLALCLGAIGAHSTQILLVEMLTVLTVAKNYMFR